MARLSALQTNMPVVIKRPGGQPVRTLIQDVLAEAFTVLAPGSEETVLLAGDEVEVTCNREDARYEFTTRVLRYLGDPPRYLLAYPEDYRRIQVRSHVRVRAALDFRYAPWPAADWPHRPPRPHKKGVTVDISGGGAQVMLREPVDKDSLLYLEMHLPGRRHQHLPLRLAGRVKRVSPRQIDGLTRYDVGLAFENITEKQEDQIVAFVFQRLLEERRQRS